MARISTYSLDTSISAQDLLVGTDAEDSNISKNYKIENLTTYIASQVATGTINKIPVFTAANEIGDSGFYQSPPTAILTVGAISLNTTFSDSTYGEIPGLRVASRVINTPGVIDLFRNDASVTAGESVGILQYSVLDDARYAVAQIGVDTLSASGTGDSGGGKFLFKTTEGGGNGSGLNTPESRFTLDYNSADFLVPINVTSATQSSFAGQVTIPETPVAGTDAASKAYVDTLFTALPSFADDAAASSLAQGRLYQTDGTGAAPLNVAGIVMRKQ